MNTISISEYLLIKLNNALLHAWEKKGKDRITLTINQSGEQDLDQVLYSDSLQILLLSFRVSVQIYFIAATIPADFLNQLMFSLDGIFIFDSELKCCHAFHAACFHLSGCFFN